MITTTKVSRIYMYTYLLSISLFLPSQTVANSDVSFVDLQQWPVAVDSFRITACAPR